MDTIDHEIIKLLQANGRISIKKMAEIISLTPPAVSERIRKLEEAGVILGYRTIIDPSKFGMNIKAIINITMAPDKRKEFIEYAKQNNCILECHHVTGGFTMTIKVILREMSELDALVGKIQQYGTTQTLIVLSTPVEHNRII